LNMKIWGKLIKAFGCIPSKFSGYIRDIVTKYNCDILRNYLKFQTFM
jgi:hypothetical protein